jgi:hypothetical protein
MVRLIGAAVNEAGRSQRALARRKASLLDGVAKANYKWTSLEYKDPTVRIVSPAAIIRSTSSASRSSPTAEDTEPAHPDELAETGLGLELL